MAEPITVDSLNSGQKINNSQELPWDSVEVPCGGCSIRRCGCLPCPESLFHVVMNGGNGTGEVDLRMQARSSVAGHLVKKTSGDSRSAPPVPSQTYFNLIAALVERNSESHFEATLPDDDEIDYEKSDVFATLPKVDATLHSLVGRDPYFPEILY
jgi:hypothetical protein